MDFSTLVMKRRSVRSYTEDPVEEDKLEQILEAARFAPTAANRQPIKLIVADTDGREDELKRIYSPEWFAKVPRVICVCGMPDQGWTRGDGKNFTDVDAAIVMDHIIMQATELGLGTCWIAAFDPKAAKDVFGIPDNVEPIVMTPLGYPANSPRLKKRKSLEEFVVYDLW